MFRCTTFMTRVCKISYCCTFAVKPPWVYDLTPGQTDIDTNQHETMNLFPSETNDRNKILSYNSKHVYSFFILAHSGVTKHY